jgi:hypothetical protein
MTPDYEEQAAKASDEARDRMVDAQRAHKRTVALLDLLEEIVDQKGSTPAHKAKFAELHETIACVAAELGELARKYEDQQEAASAEYLRIVDPEHYLMTAAPSVLEAEALCNSSRGIGGWTTQNGRRKIRATRRLGFIQP